MKHKIFFLGALSLIIAVSTFALYRASSYTFSVFNDSKCVNLPILMYHSVLPDTKRTGKYVITPEKFEEDILYLENKGYTSVSLKQVVRFVHHGEPLPEKPFLITFDDGMYNGKEYVLPILEKHNAYAVFAIVGSYADEYSQSDIVNPRYSYLRWCDIEELSDTERIEFAGHSYALHNTSGSRAGAQKGKNESSLDFISLFHEDTQKMQTSFENNGIFTPFAYAYPFGNFSKESEYVLKKSGFLATFSCIEGTNKITQGDADCLYLLKRYNRDGRLDTKKFFSKIKY